MADFLHVKPKSSWKKVKFDRDFFSSGENIGPAFVEVLENYEISSVRKKCKKKKEDLASRKKKIRKKECKKPRTEEDKDSKGANIEKKENSISRKKKIRKKEDKKLGTEESNSFKGTDDELKERQEESLKLKGRKRKLAKENKIASLKKKQKVSKALNKPTECLESEPKSSPKAPITASRKFYKPEPSEEDHSQSHPDSQGTTDQHLPQPSSSNIDVEKLRNMKPNGMSAWDGLFVPNEVLWALKEQEFTYPTPIQIRTLPHAIRDKMDILGAAETGSGKTLAFGIPLIHYILQDKQKIADKIDLSDKKTDSSVKGSDEEHSDLDSSEQTNEEHSLEDQNETTDIPEKKQDETIKTGETIKADKQEEADDSNDDADDTEGDDDVGEQDDNDDENSINDDGKYGGESDEDDEIQDIIDRETNKDQDDDMEESEDGSSDEEVEDLQEDELGCVRVVKDVDFSWFENEEQQIKKPVQTHPFALILEPTRELAIQVKQHLTAVTKYTNIKIATIVGGMSVQKQRRVLKRCPDIIVATPGRLWDLQQEGEVYLSEIEKTEYLVIDEADRMVEKGHFEELSSLLLRMNRDPQIASKRHTYVFSATLTTVHEGPQRYNQKKNKMKKFAKLTETQKLEMLMETIGLKAKPKVVDLSRKVGTVETLTEARIHCSNEEKDVHLYYFLKQYPGRTLVFCNSKDCIRRLVSVFDYLKCTPLPLHADMHQRQRLKNLDRFKGNPKGLLIASDVAARGLDIPNVQHVIHFQVPNIVENYIHRSGRTARALKEGLSVVLIGPSDMKNYKKIINTLNRDEDLPLFPVDAGYLSEVQKRVDLVREIETQEYRFQKGKRQNDWLKKMADESGIEIDDEGLLADIGDEKRQAEYRKTMKHLKFQLDRLLKEPIVTETSRGKFPTKMGKLDIPEIKSESGGAIAHLKTDKKKQEKYLRQLRKKVPSDKLIKKKKDKWAKKKRKRMIEKAAKQSDT